MEHEQSPGLINFVFAALALVTVCLFTLPVGNLALDTGQDHAIIFTGN